MIPRIYYNKVMGCIISLILVLIFSSPQFLPAEEKQILRFTGYGAPLGTSTDGTLNPLKTYELLYFNLQHQIFETLVAIDFNNQKVVPVLAEKWEASPEKIRFFLRPGVRFHNGEPFTAHAVKFSLELMKNPRQKFAGRYLLDSVADVKIVDDYTVDILTRFPDALLLRKLASIGFIFPPKYYRQAGDAYFTRYPMGTGPFRFFYFDKSENELKGIHLVANEDYWRPAPAPYKQLIFYFIPGKKQWEALKRGSVDLVITQYIESEKELKKDPSLKIIPQKTMRNSVCVLNIDKQGPLADLKVRKALQHSINRKVIIRDGLKGHGTPLYTTAPEGTLGHAANTPMYDEDVEKAKDLLKQAGYPEGFTLKVMASNTMHTIDVIEVLKKQLEQAGVRLEVHFLDRDEIVKEIISPKLMGTPQPSTFDMLILTGWPNIFGTGTNFYFLFLHSRGMFNFGIHMHKDSPVDDLYDTAMRSRDDRELCAALQRLDRYSIEQSLVIPLYQVELIYGMNKKITYNPGLNDFPHRLNQCSIER